MSIQAPHATSPTTGRASRRTPDQPVQMLDVPDALLKVQTVSAATGLSASGIQRKAREGSFPQPVRLGSRCTRWRAADVKGWLQAVAGVAA